MNPAKVQRRRVRELIDLPNVGAATAADLRRLGIETPQQLIGRDAWELYESLCRKTGVRHDPCVLDVLLAAHEFMNGGAAKPWWVFTAQRKAQWASRFKTAAKGLK